MARPVCVAALREPVVVLTAVAVAVVAGAPTAVVVAFVVAVEGLPVDLVRLLDQSRQPSPLHGTRPRSKKRPQRPSMMIRLHTHPTRSQRS